jgi:hypothetical protein
MDVSSLGASSANAFTGFGGTAGLPASVQTKLFTQTQSLSLLPPVSSPGLGGNLDLYAAVSMQSMGMLSDSRSALESANISLGIDMSVAGKEAAAGGAESPDGDEAGSSGAADGPDAAGGSPSDTSPGTHKPIGTILDQVLKESGFTAPAANPYAYRTDFFADSQSAGSQSQQYFSNPDLSNPSLGGLLDSMG